MKLTETKANSFSEVVRLHGDEHFMKRITSIGITEGTTLETVKNDRKMPVLLYTREALIALGREDAERIEVETR